MKSVIFRILIAILVVSASGDFFSEVSAETTEELLEELEEAYQESKANEEYKREMMRIYGMEETPTETTDSEPQSEEMDKSEPLFKVENEPGGAPDAMLFDKDRVYVPEKLKYNGQWWKCSEYLEDGTCAGVQIVEEAGGE